MSPKRKNLTLIFSVILFLVLVAVFIFTYRQIKEKSLLTEKTLNIWQTEVFARQELQSLENSVKKIEPKKILIESHFAQSSDIVPFLNNVENLAIQTGAKAEVSSVNILPEGPVLSVEMKAKGSFESLYKFLLLLENAPYEIQFDFFDIKKSMETEILDKQVISKWEMVFKIKLITFLTS